MTRDYASVILQVANEIWLRALANHRAQWTRDQEQRLREHAVGRTEADNSALQFAEVKGTVLKYGL